MVPTVLKATQDFHSPLPSPSQRCYLESQLINDLRMQWYRNNICIWLCYSKCLIISPDFSNEIRNVENKSKELKKINFGSQGSQVAEAELTLSSSGSKSVLLTLNYALFSSQRPQENVDFVRQESWKCRICFNIYPTLWAYVKVSCYPRIWQVKAWILKSRKYENVTFSHLRQEKLLNIYWDIGMTSVAFNV